MLTGRRHFGFVPRTPEVFEETWSGKGQAVNRH
jgi:hypothetical protein